MALGEARRCRKWAQSPQMATSGWGASWVSDVSGYQVSQHQQVAVDCISSVCPRLKHHRLLRVPAFGIYCRASMAVR